MLLIPELNFVLVPVSVTVRFWLTDAFVGCVDTSAFSLSDLFWVLKPSLRTSHPSFLLKTSTFQFPIIVFKVISAFMWLLSVAIGLIPLMYTASEPCE